MAAQKLEDRRCERVLRAPGSKRQDPERFPRYQPPLASFCHRILTVLWSTSFTLPIPQPPIPLTKRVFGTHWRTEARPLHVHSVRFSHAFTTCQATGGAVPAQDTPQGKEKRFSCVHHVPGTTGGAVPAQDTPQGKGKQRCASSVPGRKLLRAESLFPAPPRVPTFRGLLSDEGRNRWVQPESKCSPLGLTVAEIRMRPRVLTRLHGWS